MRLMADEENQTVVSPAVQHAVVMDSASLSTARRSFVQRSFLSRSQEDVVMLLGVHAPVKTEDGSTPFLVDSIQCFTFKGFLRFAKEVEAMANQLTDIGESIE